MSISWKEGDPLPNADQAEIDLRKLTDYSLQPNNPQNQGKWMGFAMIGSGKKPCKIVERNPKIKYQLID